MGVGRALNVGEGRGRYEKVRFNGGEGWPCGEGQGLPGFVGYDWEGRGWWSKVLTEVYIKRGCGFCFWGRVLIKWELGLAYVGSDLDWVWL